MTLLNPFREKEPQFDLLLNWADFSASLEKTY